MTLGEEYSLLIFYWAVSESVPLLIAVIAECSVITASSVGHKYSDKDGSAYLQAEELCICRAMQFTLF